ncbi:MAG: DMT family transporter [Xanthomonadales bacterium]|nr:DMT family transporter [Xanthomonadales bacterium]
MIMHSPSGRWKLGLALAIATALMWATLPVALKLALEVVDAYTLTWFRFLFATVALGAFMALRGQFRQFSGLSRNSWLLLTIAAVGLIGNYLGYLLGLNYTTPANAQLLIQLAPLLMAAGGVIVFKEQLRPAQWLGYGAVALGLLLFFLEQRGRAAEPVSFSFGASLILGAAGSWAIYALAQKQLLRRLDSQAVLWVIYASAAVVLLPLAQPRHLLHVDGLHWFAIIYCAVNTIGAYGAFAEALAHWEASRVSAILALTPLLTVATVSMGAAFVPGLIAPERIGVLGWTGALAVVGGSAAVSLLGRRRPLA